MSQYPNPPHPQPQWQWQPPPPPGPPPNRAGVWIAVAAGAALLLIVAFAVTAFAAPGFLVEDDSDGSSSESSDAEDDEPGDRPEVEIPPPNAGAPDAPEAPEAPEAPDIPGVPEVPEGEAPEAPAGDPQGFAEDYLTLVAAGDTAGVDASMCAADQEWQYEYAVDEQLELGLTDPRPDASAPGGILADLTGPEGTVDGRITVVPDDAGGWCVETFYVY